MKENTSGVLAGEIWGAQEEGKNTFRPEVVEGRPAKASLRLRVEPSSSKVGHDVPVQGYRKMGRDKIRQQQAAQHRAEGTGRGGCAEEPQDQALSLQLNAQLLQHQLKGCSCLLTPHLPPQLQSTGLEMLLEPLEMKLDPGSGRRKKNLAAVDKSTENGLGSGESRGEGGGCIGFHRARTLCKLVGGKRGLAIAGDEQGRGLPVATVCSG